MRKKTKVVKLIEDVGFEPEVAKPEEVATPGVKEEMIPEDFIIEEELDEVIDEELEEEF